MAGASQDVEPPDPDCVGDGRIAMRRTEAKPRTKPAHRARPVVEGLEGRQLLSALGSHPATAAAQSSASPGGVLSAKGQVFQYVTLSGGLATIRVIGVGSLQGTTVGPGGALDLVYGGTNAYSKIVGTVQGGGGHAPLASIHNLQLIAAGTPDSLTGVGGTPLAAVMMNSFDLVAGGSINLTPGVTSVILHSIGPNTNLQLRNLPPHPIYRILPANAGNTAGGSAGLYGQLVGSTSSSTTTTGSLGTVTSTTSTVGSNTGSLTGVTTINQQPVETIIGTTIVPIVTGNSSLFSGGSTGASATLEAGQSATITTTQGTTLTYVSDGGRDQILTNVGGSFTAQPNLLEPLAPGQPATQPPAPPGIILKANTIGGPTSRHINPLTDSKIFGYDSKTGQIVRFDLNLQNNTGTVDPTFAPISLPGAPATAGIDLAHLGNTPILLAPSGQTVYAFNAETGAPMGSFATALPVDFVATAGNVTVLGSTSINQLHMIDLAASLQSGTVKGLGPAPFIPASEVNLLGGLTGVAGSNNMYATVAAHFNTIQPDQLQLGIEAIGTQNVTAGPGGSSVSNGFSVLSRNGLVTNGNLTQVAINPIPVGQIGEALGAVDQNLALDTGTSGGKNTIKLLAPTSLATRGVISIAYADPLTGLSQSFRTDLGGVALIDIQGNVQSIRGNTANGVFLNDTGNLATIKVQHLINTTIVGLPISHIDTASRKNVNFFTSSRLVGNRNGAYQVSTIQPIGPVGNTGS